ncbi:hypothetical protein TVAG_173630 [Trichomonas vaginalis G3]|uniref:PQ loop repeat family protein n=1 Tax=Trichomonas vaginalis (strain ATCC PRA-98 / G3) TaxID=412133 RepID=A2EVI6_TRIV3|nr:PQ loop repeat-containing protein [Trichomonas vaginalis G3]EAY03318.1 hypothetical protein TVAG_173630 [Trichomonas vaginalis G3]KAI5498343.1 PQ loop repeat-containing protein [Trichomonas vaginalis G3]|eukprot:XP_001315541.1 hypothetical protein [Trichomonas vaginalis G3]
MSRESVEGFSLSSITLKLIGSAFLCINSLYNGSGFPLFLYGFLNTIEHCLFLFQFFRYGKVLYAPLLSLIVVIPYLICIFSPKLIPITDLVKPVTQFISHIPQLISCITRKTTLNVSIYSQHLHFIGSFLGCIMLILEENYNITNWILYGNTFIQAFSIYFLAAWYGELRLKESNAENRSVSRKVFNDSFKSV